MTRNQTEGKILMNRRGFVLKAGLFAAGSAFGSSLVGCGSGELYIPCLGPAAEPAPVPGMTYIRASQIGCALDCNLENGRNKYSGGAATDDAPRINAAMAAASASNPITLILDGSALISGLYMPAGGYWSIAGLGCGTGFFIKSGSNSDGIHNGGPNAANPSDPGPPAPPRGANVSLSNFTLNGNQGNGRNGDSSTGTRQGNVANDWYFGINLMNLDNISIQNVVVVNTPAYHVRLSNVGHVTISGCVLRSSGENTDGLHFDGPANDIAISNCSFTTGDDAIALNCPEGYTGNISRVTVTNCTFNSLTLMRLYTVSPDWGPMFYIDDVKVTNCSGTVSNCAFLIGTCRYSNPNSVNGLIISDCSLTTPVVLDLAANWGTIVLTKVSHVPLNINQAPGFAFVRTSPVFAGMTYLGSSLSINNCTITNSEDFPVAALILENGSTINNLEFNGFAVQDASGTSFSTAPQLLNIMSGSIGQLALSSLNSAHIAVPVSAGGFSSIGSISGSGVLATGWEFPDSVMANNVPYISASTHQPSIKIDGVVESYTGA
ncbi:glycosyl hydrolase family 28 protein [Acidicapsa acidisoli]|uniref:glycosyl hydrolase family 28 protein n=1 Tax=Acidicapsa acidisoli TaxID=1615681 RepID=UPI0021E0A356|nr:glycosyl hydrolase family 28 protein [Acidicapsa acidisoli]